MSARRIASLAAVLVFAAPAAAQTWTGAASGNWTTATNWNTGTVPASSSNTQLTFGASPNTAMTDTIAGTFLLNRMTFDAGGPAYSLGGNDLDFRTNVGLEPPSIVMNSDSAV